MIGHIAIGHVQHHTRCEGNRGEIHLTGNVQAQVIIGQTIGCS